MSPRQILHSVVSVKTTVADDAFTAPMLGTERGGSGVVIRDGGLVLTIGYLVTEAEQVVLGTADGRSIPGHVMAFDQVTGFGLVQALGELGLPAVPLGSSAGARPGDAVTVAAARQGAIEARIVAKQEFAGYWEYLLDEAIFAAPAHPLWGGAALLDAGGRLLGIGSLRLQVMGEDGEQDINMFVPIDLLPPVLDDLVASGGTKETPRPWLGLYAGDDDGRVVVMNADPRGPAAAAGLRRGDVIADVRDQSVDSLADFYRRVWECGQAGVEIPLRIVRDGRELWLRVRSTDRRSLLKRPVLQ